MVKGYTKHYYAGTDLCASREQSQACLSYAEMEQSVRSNRICAKTGGGFGESITRSFPDLQATADSLFSQSRENIRCRELLQNNMECVVSYGHVPDAEMKVHLYEMPSHFRADAEIHLGEFHSVVEWCEHEFFEEDDVFFYHSDHLGSASWITDAHGYAVQHLQYLPFGEPFVDQHPFGYSERFRFTGKERDEETGYGYFGARYMDHELMTMWLSVDPMADKYPSISPYAYCAWNPVKLVDPDGREFDPTTEEKYIKPYENEVRERIKRIDALRGTADWKPEYDGQYSEYQNILTEIGSLRKDEHNVYSIHTGVKMKKKTTYGELRYSGVNSSGQRKISINLATKQKDVFIFMGTMAHELKHAYQYYNKQLGFILSNGIQTSSSNSQALEREAHIRGDMFSGCHNVTNKQGMRFNFELNPSNYEFPQGASYLDYPAATNVNEFSRRHGSNFIYNNF